MKQRLDALRDEPAAPVDLQLRVDAGLVQALKALAAQQQQPVERSIEDVLRKHSLDAEE